MGGGGASHDARKSGVIGLVGMGERVHLEAQLPDELRSLVYWDAIPIQSVGVGLRFVFPGAENVNLGVCSGGFSELRVGGHGGKE